ncbi:MAG TPA: hypothetical protein PLP75_01110 [Burkholderiales bacterium]|nr:hypothetical protein [Burkholderiales bacterium]
MTNNETIVQNEKPKSNRFMQIIDNNRQLLNSIVFSILCSVIVMTLYLTVIEKKINKHIACVDVQSLMKDLTVSTFQQMNGLNPDKQTMIAADNIKLGAAKVEQAIAMVAMKNNLVLIQKQALAYDKDVPDYTEVVRNEIKELK